MFILAKHGYIKRDFRECVCSDIQSTMVTVTILYRATNNPTVTAEWDKI